MTVVFRQFYKELILPIADNDTARGARARSVDRAGARQTGLLEMGDTVKPTLSALMGLVGLVLLIACVNVANLMVARAERSHRDTAISLALGATRLRVWTQGLLESLVISTVGLILGLSSRPCESIRAGAWRRAPGNRCVAVRSLARATIRSRSH